MKKQGVYKFNQSKETFKELFLIKNMFNLTKIDNYYYGNLYYQSLLFLI